MEADLHRFYGLDLDDMYAGALRPRKVANLVEHLPRGAAVWVQVGGQMAITDETESLWSVEHTILAVAHALGKGKGPEPRHYPKGRIEERRRALDSTKHAVSNAERWRAKYLGR